MAAAAGRIPDEIGGRALETILDGLRAGAALLDDDLRYRYVNEVLAALSGFAPAAHIGRRLTELMPSLTDAVYEPARQAMATGTVVTRSGDVLESAASPGVSRRFATRWIPLAVGVLVVVTEESSPDTIDEVVAASERRYRTLVEASSAIVWRTDATGRPHADAVEWASLMGVPTADGSGDDWLAAVHPDERDRVAAAWATAIDTGTLYEIEYRLRRPEGGWRHVSVRAVPIHQDGRVVEWVGATTDVSETRGVVARLRLAVEAARMGTFEWDIPAKRVRWGPETASLFGADPTTAKMELGYDEVLSFVGTEQRERIERALAAAIADGGDFEHEIEAQRGFEKTWLLVRGRFELGDDGAPESMMGVVVDITERHALHEASRRSAERAAQLGRVAAALSQTMGGDEVARAVLEQAQEALDATGGAVVLLTEDGAPRWAAVLGYDSEIAAAVEAIGLDVERPLTAAVRTKQPQFVSSRDEMAERFPAVMAALTAAGDHAVCGLPLSTGGRMLGAVMLSFDRPIAFDDDQRVFLMALADTCAQAFERARLYEREHEVAEVLQRALLPDRLVDQEGLELAARYVPGTEGVAVGGDWYDVFDLGDGRLGIAVGDVVGKGVVAAAVMGRLRNALRAHATSVDAPAEVLARIDDFALRFGPDDLATVLYGVLDVGSGELRLASAGHLPPLLVDADGGSSLVEFEPGVPVGVGGAGLRPEHRVRLAPGATLVLYTDGLVEDRRRPLDEGLFHLVRAGSTLVAPHDVEGGSDALVTALVGAGGDDDLAVLVLRWTGAGDPDRLSVLLAGEARSARRGRLLVREQLEAWDRDDLAEVALLCVSELVTNAVVHARTDALLTVTRHGSCIRFEVADRGTAQPERLDAAPDAVHGRGVAIVEALASGWGVDDVPGGGKSVWFELAGP